MPLRHLVVSVAVNVMHTLPDTLWAELLQNEAWHGTDPLDALGEILALQKINEEDHDQHDARWKAFEAWQESKEQILAEREQELDELDEQE